MIRRVWTERLLTVLGAKPGMTEDQFAAVIRERAKTGNRRTRRALAALLRSRWAR